MEKWTQVARDVEWVLDSMNKPFVSSCSIPFY